MNETMNVNEGLHREKRRQSRKKTPKETAQKFVS